MQRCDPLAHPPSHPHTARSHGSHCSCHCATRRVTSRHFRCHRRGPRHCHRIGPARPAGLLSGLPPGLAPELWPGSARPGGGGLRLQVLQGPGHNVPRRAGASPRRHGKTTARRGARSAESVSASRSGSGCVCVCRPESDDCVESCSPRRARSHRT